MRSLVRGFVFVGQSTKSHIRDKPLENDLVTRFPSIAYFLCPLRLGLNPYLYVQKHRSSPLGPQKTIQQPSYVCSSFSYDTVPPWIVPTPPICTYLSSLYNSEAASCRMPSPTPTRSPFTLMGPSQRTGLGVRQSSLTPLSEALCCHLL